MEFVYLDCLFEKADNPLKKDDKKLKLSVFKFGLFLAIYLFVAAVLSFGFKQGKSLCQIKASLAN